MDGLQITNILHHGNAAMEARGQIYISAQEYQQGHRMIFLITPGAAAYVCLFTAGGWVYTISGIWRRPVIGFWSFFYWRKNGKEEENEERKKCINNTKVVLYICSKTLEVRRRTGIFLK